MVTVITGVGRKGQVGEALAAFLGKRGDRIAIVSRDEREVNERAAELRQLGCHVTAYACDLADARAVAAFTDALHRDHGDHIDALVNAAGGFALSGPVATSDPAVFQQMLAINLQTAYFTTRALLPGLVRARGSVVFFASEAALEGVSARDMAAYAASKAAVIALMRSIAEEVRQHGARANALAPGTIRTSANLAAIGSAGPFVETRDVAAMVAFLCSPESRSVTGQVIRLRPVPHASPSR